MWSCVEKLFLVTGPPRQTSPTPANVVPSEIYYGGVVVRSVPIKFRRAFEDYQALFEPSDADGE